MTDLWIVIAGLARNLDEMVALPECQYGTEWVMVVARDRDEAHEQAYYYDCGHPSSALDEAHARAAWAALHEDS